MRKKITDRLLWIVLVFGANNFILKLFNLITGDNESILTLTIFTITLIVADVVLWFLFEKLSVNKIKIKYFTDIDKVRKISIGDLIDLRAAEDVEMKAGEFKLIPLGVAMELPYGYKANIYPRSSTYKNFKIILANSVGQVDSSYRGDSDQWYFPAIALEDTVIHKNDRICQFEIVEQMATVKFIEVESLGNKDRGGIGSTGTK